MIENLEHLPAETLRSVVRSLLNGQTVRNERIRFLQMENSRLMKLVSGFTPPETQQHYGDVELDAMFPYRRLLKEESSSMNRVLHDRNWKKVITVGQFLSLVQLGIIIYTDKEISVNLEMINSPAFQQAQADQHRHLAVFPMETLRILNEAKESGQEHLAFKVGDREYVVKTKSDRYECFLNSMTCVACGMVGEKLVLDQDHHHRYKHNVAHFNMYGHWRGGWIMFTKDHINPRSNGGPNHIHNYQTMCRTCNETKRSQVVTLEELQNFPSILERRNEISQK